MAFFDVLGCFSMKGWEMKEDRLLWILIVVILLLLCCCVLVMAVGFFAVVDGGWLGDFTEEWGYWTDEVTPLTSRDELLSLNVTDEGDLGVLYAEVYEGYARLLANDVPEDARVSLLVKLGGLPSVPLFPRKPLIYYDEGQMREFFVQRGEEWERVATRLAVKTVHVMFWVEEGVEYDAETLVRLVETFEEDVIPRNRALFGTEWTPGVDGDPLINVLFVEMRGTDLTGFFSPKDEYSKKVILESNAAEMFYVNADGVRIGEDFPLGILAHEYQHLIHWHADSNESLWLNEGLAMLAGFLAEKESVYGVREYVRQPDFALTTWDEEGDWAHYGASFLFVNYLFDRFGEEMIFELVQNVRNDLGSVDDWLAKEGILDTARGRILTTEDVVLDWMVTNLVGDEDVMDGRFGYGNYAGAPRVWVEEMVTPAMVREEMMVFGVDEFGADYLRVDAGDGFVMHFDGDDFVRLIEEPVTEGDFAFWAGEAALSSMVLNREFDFRGVEGPILMTFDMWFDLDEEDGDAVFLLASVDEGRTWDLLGGERYFKGSEGDWLLNGVSDGWVIETVDLSAYAGERVLLQFETFYAGGVGPKGFFLDDVTIEAIGYATGFEEADASWQAEGFVRVNDLLPQGFAVAAVIDDGEEKMVEYLTLDARNQFDFSIEAGEADEVTFVITGTTRFVTTKAGYCVWFE